VGYLALVASAVAAAVGIVAQTVAARRARQRGGVDPGLLVRLATDRLYLVGFAAQVLAFLLAFLARGTLPLFLVQAGSSSAVGIAAVLGFLVLGWRVGRGEIVALVLMVGGLLLLVAAAEPTTAADVPAWLGWVLFGLLASTAAAAFPAARLAGARGAVAMGALAGLAFAILAVASRPVAALPLLEMPLSPLAWLMIAAALIGQLMLAGALQRGSATSAAASMDATTTVTAAVAGLAVLGDAVVAGRLGWVVMGLVLVVASVVLLAVFGRSATESAAVDLAEEVADLTLELPATGEQAAR
jgi:drug/metabolite transporter (DMT)-like permease